MKRLLLLLMIGAVVHQPARAQTSGGSALTLEQCIDYALENSINIKNAVLDEEIADARVKETRTVSCRSEAHANPGNKPCNR